MSGSKQPSDDALMPELPTPVTERDHHENPISARWHLVEYGDYESPACAEHRHVIRELLLELGEDLCYVYRHFPETKVHPRAQAAAEAAEAAGMQGKFWLMHERIFEHQSDLSDAVLRGLARDLPLQLDHYTRDLVSGEPRQLVADDVAEAEEAGVEEIPTFFVNGRMHVGKHDFESLRAALVGPAPIE